MPLQAVPPQDRTPHDRPPHDRTPHDRPPHDRTPHDRTPHDWTPGARTPRGGRRSAAALKGLVTLFTGVVVLTCPALTTATFATLLGGYLIVAGVLDAARCVTEGHACPSVRLLFALQGTLLAVAGALALAGMVRAGPFCVLLGLVWLVGGIVELMSVASDPWRPGALPAAALAVATTLAGEALLVLPVASLELLALIAGAQMVVGGGLTAYVMSA
ncbi:hypothetical protein FXF51_03245 [Nonomuraea sp. PA05]|uniref:DUF308 domain-containing protein n=1 Tax=Nonomuraea sp. PA05 TaxID=2604466 RepID=UPI0011DB1CF5|nr:DUF308 domain-containing protein [Nonomuraea sp. PA05]TYB70113.1 hypothetical protein FXF51_03245 [Nonomuraea sp. PA05]